jgi:Xaa-Pro aminopeptidase
MITRDVALEKAQRALNEHGLDALVAVSPWNVAYTSGTSFLTQRTIPERLGMIVLTPGNEPVFVYCTIEEGHAKGESWIREFRGYTEFADKPIEVLADVLREKGAHGGKVGIEKRFLVAGNYEELLELLPDADLVDADAIFDRMRAIKTPQEVEWLGQTALWTDAAIATAFEQSRIGDTERAVGDRMIAAAAAKGATTLLHLVLATGPNLFKAHHFPGDTPLDPSGVVRTDFGMFWNGGYVSDIARTILIAPNRQDQFDTYRNLEAIHQTVIAAMNPGVRASDLYRLCADTFAKRGIEFSMPHIGHSIGLGVHEYPMIHPFDETVLEPGMVFMLEPLVVGKDGFYHTEDMIEITKDGHRVLSRSRDWSEPLVIG